MSLVNKNNSSLAPYPVHTIAQDTLLPDRPVGLGTSQLLWGTFKHMQLMADCYNTNIHHCLQPGTHSYSRVNWSYVE